MKKYLINLVIAIVIVISNMSMSFGQETVKVVYYDRPPFHYGNNEGSMIDMLKHVLKDYNLDIVKTSSQEAALSAVETGEFQIAMGFQLYDFEERIKSNPNLALSLRPGATDPVVLWEAAVININQHVYENISNMPYLKTYALIKGTYILDEITSPRYKLIETNSPDVIFKRLSGLRYDFTWFGYYEGCNMVYKHKLHNARPTGNKVYDNDLYYITNVKTSKQLRDRLDEKLTNFKQYENTRYESIGENAMEVFLKKVNTNTL